MTATSREGSHLSNRLCAVRAFTNRRLTFVRLDHGLEPLPLPVAAAPALRSRPGDSSAVPPRTRSPGPAGASQRPRSPGPGSRSATSPSLELLEPPPYNEGQGESRPFARKRKIRTGTVTRRDLDFRNFPLAEVYPSRLGGHSSC